MPNKLKNLWIWTTRWSQSPAKTLCCDIHEHIKAQATFWISHTGYFFYFILFNFLIIIFLKFYFYFYYYFITPPLWFASKPASLAVKNWSMQAMLSRAIVQKKQRKKRVCESQSSEQHPFNFGKSNYLLIRNPVLREWISSLQG